MVNSGSAARGDKTAQNKDHKYCCFNLRRRGFLKGRRVANEESSAPVLAGVHIFPSHLSIRQIRRVTSRRSKVSVGKEEPIP